jgi:hypothetical protein
MLQAANVASPIPDAAVNAASQLTEADANVVSGTSEGTNRLPWTRSAATMELPPWAPAIWEESRLRGREFFHVHTSSGSWTPEPYSESFTETTVMLWGGTSSQRNFRSR